MAVVEQQPRGADEQMPLPVQADPRNATPVYGTAQPAGGGSGALRRLAYEYPAHDPKRWLMLLAADRVEIGGALARDATTPAGMALAVRHFTRQARAYPHSSAVLLGVLAGGLLGWALGGRRA